ncbi:MAG: hypothetical protein LH702_01035 [Phormidesmis sp. CAN_BIN44]|nr:hypothetical protein [Phormidesmis sp. CAN_BIN44]
MKNLKRRKTFTIAIHRICFSIFGCFGLMAFIWGRCKNIPDDSPLLRAFTIVPLCLFSTVWVIAVSPIILLIGAIGDGLPAQQAEGFEMSFEELKAHCQAYLRGVEFNPYPIVTALRNHLGTEHHDEAYDLIEAIVTAKDNHTRRASSE